MYHISSTRNHIPSISLKVLFDLECDFFIFSLCHRFFNYVLEFATFKCSTGVVLLKSFSMPSEIKYFIKGEDPVGI